MAITRPNTQLARRMGQLKGLHQQTRRCPLDPLPKLIEGCALFARMRRLHWLSSTAGEFGPSCNRSILPLMLLSSHLAMCAGMSTMK